MKTTICIIGDAGHLDYGPQFATYARLKSEGTYFANFVANPIGSHSMFELLFARYPIENGNQAGFSWWLEQGTNAGGFPTPALPLNRTSLAHAFKATGHHTALFGKWGIGRLDDRFEPVLRPRVRAMTPHAFGFDHWAAGIGSNVKSGAATGNPGTGFDEWQRWDNADVSIESVWADFAIANSWIAWDSAFNPTDARFSVVWFEGAHGPYDKLPPPAALPFAYTPDASTKRGRYNAILTAVDSAIGVIADAHDFTKDRLVVFCAAGTPDDPALAPNPNRAKRSVYEAGVHVPAFALGPAYVPGVTAGQLLCPWHLWGALGAPPAFGVRSGADSDGTFLHIQGQSAFRTATDKLVRHESGAEEFYDVASDPLEANPLPLEGPIYNGLRAELDQWHPS